MMKRQIHLDIIQDNGSQDHRGFEVLSGVKVGEIDNFMIKTNYHMNDYQTPRRRHSSLFQRMEDEINKISKKLSAAKQHRQSHTHSRKNTISHPLPSFNPLIDTPEETVRISKRTQYGSKEFTRKPNYLGDRTNLKEQSARAPVRRLRFGFDESQGHEVKKLMEENQILEEQVKMLQTICQQQAFKVGYLRAQSRQRQNMHQLQKTSFNRQQVYLNKLAEGYRLKVQKYKRILGDEESLELSVGDM